MIMQHEPIPIINENHRRSISTTLSLLDEMLDDFQRLAREHEKRSVLFEQTNSLTPADVALIEHEAAAMRSVIARLRDDLALASHVRDAATSIWSKATVMWESLCELQAKRLKAFGDVPANLSEYLDPQIDELNQRLNRIAEAAMGRREVRHE
jgi:hypothetical protein